MRESIGLLLSYMLSQMRMWSEWLLKSIAFLLELPSSSEPMSKTRFDALFERFDNDYS